MRSLIFALLLALPAVAAGPLIIGVRGGLPLTEILDNSDAPGALLSDSRRYTFGPTVGLRLPSGFSIEADALYKRFTIETPGNIVEDFPIRRDKTNSWEFPIMLKWKARGAAVSPFVGAGVSVRHWADLDDVDDFVTSGRAVADKSNNVGFVFGGGLNFQAGPLRISPEIRWTRWNENNIRDAIGNILESNRNQAEILVGFTF